jgi:putative PIN family toxin of toxin-antitoxin system
MKWWRTPGRSAVRAVIDTNVLVSGILSPAGHSSRIIAAMERRAFVPVFTDVTLLELKDAVTDPRQVRRFGWRLEPLNQVVAILTRHGLSLPQPELVRFSRDPDDDIFIALAVQASADYLVTRDDDLKGDAAVREHLEAHGVGLVTVREFLALLEAQEGEPGGSPSC